MTLADSATIALALTAACAVAARLVGALTTSGAVAGAAVGACVSLGFGLPGLAVLGTFFVVGTLATRIGWATKKARGTAEAGEGRRDWKRVVGKGGVAAACGLLMAVRHDDSWIPAEIGLLGFPGAISAALADTLATEIGTLSHVAPRLLPSFRRVEAGTPGAVSVVGIVGAILGGKIVAIVWFPAFGGRHIDAQAGIAMLAIAYSGVFASIAESIAVSLGLRAPGFVRNVLTTAVGAALSVPALREALQSGGWEPFK